MNKARLVDELSKQLDLPKSTAESYLVELVDLMSSELKNGNEFNVSGLGQFETRERTSYIAYNPHYKKKMRVPAKQIVQFTPSKNVKDELKESGL
jgi:DNA-binding protein HU-beta